MPKISWRSEPVLIYVHHTAWFWHIQQTPVKSQTANNYTIAVLLFAKSNHRKPMTKRNTAFSVSAGQNRCGILPAGSLLSLFCSVGSFLWLDTTTLDFPGSPVIGLLTSTAGGLARIPCQGTKVLHIMQFSQKKKNIKKGFAETLVQ